MEGKLLPVRNFPVVKRNIYPPFLGFAPAENPIIMGLIMVNEPTGIYYGGTIAAPVMSEIFENILPYLGVEQNKTFTALD